MTQIIQPLIEAYRRGLRPDAVTEALLKRIATSNINAFISVLSKQADAEAKALSESIAVTERPLYGIAVGIKDLIDVQGCATTMGAYGFEENIASQDAEVVARLRAAGAVIIGKTNTHQFAYGPMGDRSAAGPVLNPHNVAHMTGGSSSGSAAAVAAGLVHAAVGTDTAASVRLPAAFCGVVGMKPTIGLTSAKGVFPLSRTLDHLGPITAGCRDNARMLAVMAGRDATAYSDRIGRAVNELVVGLPEPFFNTYWSKAVDAAMSRAMHALEKAGARLRAVTIPKIEEIYEAQQCILRAEAYALHADRLRAGAPYDDEVRERLLAGKNILDETYNQALKFQSVARTSFDEAFEQVDVLLTPTCGITAPRLYERETLLNGEKVPTRWLLTRLTAPTNLSGHPSLSVPFGKDEANLPMGLQLIGRYDEEAILYQLGDFLARRS